MGRRWVLAAAVLLMVGASGFCQSSAKSGPGAFSLTVTPSFDIPLFADAALYNVGAGAKIEADYRLPSLPLFFFGANLGYSFVPLGLTYIPFAVSLINAGLDAGIRFDPMERLSLRAQASGGYFYGLVNDGSSTGGANPFLSAGVSASWAILPALSLGLGASYRHFFGLYNDLAVSLGATFVFGAAGAESRPAKAPKEPVQKKPAPLKQEAAKQTPQTQTGKGVGLTGVALSGIFPAFFKFYNTNPVGKAVLHNWENQDARDIRVTFLVKQYMDNPKQCGAPTTLAAGQEAPVDLFGLFKSTILEVSEPTLVSANLVVEYTIGGEQRRQEYTETLRINNRNAMNWEDDQRAAAFVTIRDPTVLKFSKNVSAMLKGKASNALNPKLLSAIGIHEALRLYGLEYVIDPTTPFEEYSQKKDAVDFLQFPQQTLEYKAGDCDDLSILYSAILESVGVETAFITIPGHIYMAISLDVDPDDARRLFFRPDDLIFREGKTWLPIEVTLRDGDFLKAWETGARQWRENQPKGLAEIYPVRDCWKRYEAVGFSSTVVPIAMPPADQVVRAYTDEVASFVNREISTRVSSLQAEVKRAQDPSKPTNRIGILYAQYGLYEPAEKEFLKLADKEYVPALLNLGTLFYARGDMRKALSFYQRAQKKEPSSVNALLGLARVNHELENYGEARAAYAAMRSIDPALAERFAYLDLRGEEAARAAEAGQVKGEMLWAEAK